eukprot:2179452-Amphidinium_carterae.2
MVAWKQARMLVPKGRCTLQIQHIEHCFLSLLSRTAVLLLQTCAGCGHYDRCCWYRHSTSNRGPVQVSCFTLECTSCWRYENWLAQVIAAASLGDEAARKLGARLTEESREDTSQHIEELHRCESISCANKLSVLVPPVLWDHCGARPSYMVRQRSYSPFLDLLGHHLSCVNTQLVRAVSS